VYYFTKETKAMNKLIDIFVGQDNKWKEAEEVTLELLNIRTRMLGEHRLATLSSMGTLAMIFWKQERNKEAERLEAQVMEISATKFSEDSEAHINYDDSEEGEDVDIGAPS
jgi:hypothetical protein